MATSASRGAGCATLGARNLTPRRQRYLDKRSNTTVAIFSAIPAPFGRVKPPVTPATPASGTAVSVEFQCSASSPAARLLRHHPLAVLQTAAHGTGVNAARQRTHICRTWICRHSSELSRHVLARREQACWHAGNVTA